MDCLSRNRHYNNTTRKAVPALTKTLNTNVRNIFTKVIAVLVMLAACSMHQIWFVCVSMCVGRGHKSVDTKIRHLFFFFRNKLEHKAAKVRRVTTVSLSSSLISRSTECKKYISNHLSDISYKLRDPLECHAPSVNHLSAQLALMET